MGYERHQPTGGVVGFYTGKHVVITGGSSGIGRSAALQVAREGGRVAIVARNQARLDATLAELNGIGEGGHVAYSVDVTDEHAVTAMVASVLADLGHVDVLICNSGFARCGAVSDMSVETFRQMMDTNFFGHLHVTRALVPHFKQRKSGTISLVTSMLGFMSIYGYAAYSASKYAIVGFADGLRQEMLPYNVGVNVFYPPTTDTPGLATENESKPELTWAIEGQSRQFTPDQVAATLLAAIAKGAYTSMIGVDSWAIYWLSRWVPSLVRFVVDRDVWSFVKKNGSTV